MNDPINRLKSQPWVPLSQVAILTTVLAIAIDSLFILALSQSESVRRLLSLLFTPPLGRIIPIAATVGFGVLGVYICERWRSQQVFINTSSLWALVLCLIVGLFIKSVLPIPSLLVGFSYPAIFGIMVGVFWKGRSYWRY